MLQQLTDGTIQESYTTVSSGNYSSSNCIEVWPPPQTLYWNSYPVYVCTDKTKKAIDILKALQADKQIRCDSVPRFIALVEKISALL